jgi:hypothetical protein
MTDSRLKDSPGDGHAVVQKCVEGNKGDCAILVWEEPVMKFQIRGFVSLFLVLAFLVLTVSGVVLYITPRGRVANWTGWTMLGLDKQTWQSMHMSISLLFLIGVLLHLWLNWAMFWCYIKKKTSVALNLKAEMLAATLLAGAVVTGAIFHVPPFRNILDLNYQIKDYWDRWADNAAVSPPTPHAEELTLEWLAANMRVPLDDLIKSLKDEGVAVDGGSQTLGQVAEKNSITPGEVYAAIHKHFPDADQSGQGFGQGRGQHKGQGGGGKGRGKDRSMD